MTTADTSEYHDCDANDTDREAKNEEKNPRGIGSKQKERKNMKSSRITHSPLLCLCSVCVDVDACAFSLFRVRTNEHRMEKN